MYSNITSTTVSANDANSGVADLEDSDSLINRALRKIMEVIAALILSAGAVSLWVFQVADLWGMTKKRP